MIITIGKKKAGLIINALGKINTIIDFITNILIMLTYQKLRIHKGYANEKNINYVFQFDIIIIL